MIESFHINYPEMVVQKSKGLTESEEKLATLGYRTFLQLWSYPNPYKMQDNGQELCDMLVVFDNHIIIFSDKDCLYRKSGDPQVDWRRWYKAAIHKSVRQLVGAKNWITNHPDRIAIDAKCKKKFPFKIEITKDTKFHLIAVAHGASERCKEYFSGGDGGLCINNQIVENMHIGSDCQPFYIGQVLADEQNFVHVFDDASYANILQELDTIQDFIRYLEARKELLLTKAVFAESENNILALHIQGVIRGNAHHLQILSKDCNIVTLTGQMLEDVKQSPQYISWKKKMFVSYFWDEMLQKTFFFIENGLSSYISHPTVQDQSRLFERMASEDRAHRYVLATGFLSFLSSVDPDVRGTRIICDPDNPDTAYLLFLLPRKESIEDSVYRDVRRGMLADYCMIAKLDYPPIQHIVGVALESNSGEYSSEDFVYLDVTNWTDEQQQEALSLKMEYQRIGALATRLRNESHFDFKSLERSY